jgi:predicted DNA-binding protein
MNTDMLAWATFVFDRTTSERLGYISKRMGVSRSLFVWEVLEEPIAFMAKWVESVSDELSQDQAEALFGMMHADLEKFFELK